ncbi:MAG TPA: hypothetical protein VL614_00640 [Acetobacteraceae bacterium]|jgi:hypothetical protein|nr:hypothetical protein [Acetobacteraceae bacterium]
MDEQEIVDAVTVIVDRAKQEQVSCGDMLHILALAMGLMVRDMDPYVVNRFLMDHNSKVLSVHASLQQKGSMH